MIDLERLHRLDGRVAVVTGASSGIGRRFAEVLDAAGAEVCIVARREERLREIAAGMTRATVLPFDLGDADTAGSLIDEVHERHGRIDLLVNNAGVTNVVPAIKEEIADARRVIELNLMVPFVLAQAAARVMRRDGGTIVNIASVMATTSIETLPEASYVASKGAVASLTRELAVQWSRYGIRVNALAPGMFATEMTVGLTDDDEASAAFGQRLPLGRVGTVEELDAAILFLTSPANTYLTGQMLTVDGGISCV